MREWRDVLVAQTTNQMTAAMLRKDAKSKSI